MRSTPMMNSMTATVTMAAAMSLLGGALALAVLASGCATPSQRSLQQRRGGQYHQVIGVVSGDTFVADLRLDGGMHRLNVKLIGVRAPRERAGFTELGARSSTAELGRQLARGWVRLEFNNQLNEPLRHYDGTLVADQECWVFVPPAENDQGGHETFLNRELLEIGVVVRDDGVARDDRGGLGEYVDRMDEAEGRARADARGLWALPR